MVCEKQIVNLSFVPMLKPTKTSQSGFPIMNWPEGIASIIAVVLIDTICLICSIYPIMFLLAFEGFEQINMALFYLLWFLI